MPNATSSPTIPALERQLLDGVDLPIPDVVEHLGGLNAQTLRGPSVGLRARIQDFDQEALDRELRSYRLVKANLMRGTVHLVTARQYRAWREALQPALEKTVKGFCPGLYDDVPPAEIALAAVEALSERGPEEGLTRAELGEAMAKTLGYPEPAKLGFAARLLAPLVQVADHSLWRSGRTRYVLAAHVLSGAFLDSDEGLADLLTTYARAHGPVTAADATYYTGLTRLGGPLKEHLAVVGGTTRTPVFDHPSPPEGAAPADVVVLPEYDSVYFARKEGPCKDARKRLIPNTATDMHGSVLVDGSLVAGWTPAKGTVSLDDGTVLPQEAHAAWTQFQHWYAETSKSADRGAKQDRTSPVRAAVSPRLPCLLQTDHRAVFFSQSGCAPGVAQRLASRRSPSRVAACWGSGV